MTRPAITCWLTRADRSALFTRQPAPIPFAAAAGGLPAIEVDPARRFQVMEGFGFSLTGGSAKLIAGLAPAAREALLQELFAPAGEGLGISYLRLSVGASDLSEACFSYDDLPAGESDPGLDRFDLLAGDRELIPLLREILAIAPELKIMASPWSAPPWMKDNGRFAGGRLLPEHYPVYAAYLVRYLREMRRQGIVIHSLTPQNEPLNRQNEPSMAMTAEEQAAFIGLHLGPALREAGLGEVEIYCWDHNCDVIDYPLRVLADPLARPFVTGVAWHLYGGEIDALTTVQQLWPEKKMAFTEQWVGADGEFAGDLVWHMKHVLVGATKNWARLVLEWNLASDPWCGPHTPGGEPHCVGAVTIGDEVSRNVSYYVIAHAARLVRPGAVRIFSGEADYLPNVAFATAAGEIVLIVVNEGAEPRRFAIRVGEEEALATLEGGAAATYLWRRD